jgi:hypothetical protein
VKRSLQTLALVIAALGTALAAAQTRTPSTIPVSEIRPGMRGYGLTVFRGTDPERFDVEVIDVLHNFRPDQDLILVRTPHPILDRAATVAGMSGSPIYLDGRLAGAYAYGWAFGEDPLAGVTPIANMLAEMSRAVRPDSFPGAELLPRTATAEAPRRDRRLAGLPAWSGDGRTGALDPIRRWRERVERTGGGMVPVSTPLLMGGFDDRVARILGDELEEFGLVALQTGGGSRPTGAAGAPARFVDGGAIGVQLIRGDVSATAIGTVTHVAGRRLVAFGHPMMDAGETGLPTCTARVLHILVSEARSFKLAEADAPLGTLIQDRQAAIVVDSSLPASTVPMRIRVSGVPGAARTEWNVEVVNHRMLTPLFALAAAANALGATASDADHVVVTARQRIAIVGHAPIELVDHVATSEGPSDARALSSLRAFELLDATYGNPFEETRIERIDIDLAVEFRRDWERILDVAVTDQQVDPGARVNLHVVMRKFGAPDRVRIVPVEIPMAAAGRQLEVRIEPGDAVALEQPLAEDFDDILGIVQRRLPATSLVVSMTMPTRGLRFGGHVVADLPGSALDVLTMSNDTSAGVPFTTVVRSEVDAGNVVVGSARITLDVRSTPRHR